jgi:hypothetical protein
MKYYGQEVSVTGTKIKSFLEGQSRECGTFVEYIGRKRTWDASSMPLDLI